ncbi:hypothetical protein PV327_003487 [Microctonus hyperodae]|uniref:Citrate transporter-like domain-containing protein n=1 Tax=Microctonus hyperodae TaxID=165561 RepID=A0AA39L187_MICHY|nr:hypothetical protein PV327_003487 [Microctonus hyperodae]
MNIPLIDSSDDEQGYQTPISLDYPEITITNVASSASSSEMNSGVFESISNEFIDVWNQFPQTIKLDPSLAHIQRRYNRMSSNSDQSEIQKFSPPAKNRIERNMSLTTQANSGNEQESGANKQILNVDKENTNYHSHKLLYRYIKLILLTCCWIIFTIILMIKSENTTMMREIAVPSCQVRNHVMLGTPMSNRVLLELEGPLLHANSSDVNYSTNYLIVWLEISEKNHETITQNLTEPWEIPLLPSNLMNTLPKQQITRTFELNNLKNINSTNNIIYINLRTNSQTGFIISIGYDLSPIDYENGIIFSILILIGLYILIIFEIIHRALAAMLASTMSIAALSILNERPTMSELISWIDIDTILLLFSMMMLVAIFAETGIFDYLAVYAFKITGGKTWPLINTLCFFTAFMSSFLDNVTIVLLMTPVTIRLCEVMELNPVPILTAMLIYSNIGGALTPVGDPPNVIITTNQDVINAGITFGSFILHTSVGVILAFFIAYVHLRFIFRDTAILGFDEPQDIQDLRHEIVIWQRAANSLSTYSKDENVVRETLMKKVHKLEKSLKKILEEGNIQFEKYKNTLEELQEKYPIRDKSLLIKCSIALIFIITLFFIHNLPNLNLSLGWSALLGVILLLVLADTEDLDGIMARVEWSTLIFFAALFILMEALSRMGLITWIGKQTEWIILSVNENFRLAVAILLIMWVSAFASAFVDNVPLATMMVRIAANISKNDGLNLPLPPLIWALTFGACLGGNATLIGASANVVCAGVAEQHGYRLTFMKFFKVGFPIMISTTATASFYLVIAHVVFNWH